MPNETDYVSRFEAASKNADEPSWLAELRRKAIDDFQRQGFPTTKNEWWRDTSVKAIVESDFRDADGSPDVPKPLVNAATLEGAIGGHRVAFVNGKFSDELSHIGALPEGVFVGRLSDFAKAHPDKFEQLLAQTAKTDDAPFAALNTAFWRDGACVFVPKGQSIDETVHIVYLTQTNGHATIDHPRNLIVLEDDAKADVIEHYVGMDKCLAYFNNVVTEVVMGERAFLDHLKLQQESPCAFHVATMEIRQRGKSNFATNSISLGGRLVRNDFSTALDGEFIESTMDGLFLVDGEQHVDHHTKIDHLMPNCHSFETFKGILGGKSRGVFNGRIYVEKDAQKTDAKQTSRNLLLSKDATANARPQLEIYADDVKCTHGATIGQLDSNALFYLRSRGIGEAEAYKILVYAFAGDMIHRIKNLGARETLEAKLIELLPKATYLEEAS
ncbi:MAG: Fe-S cluster assembly protein SufD [Deltaproteobacteria bacterium]|nr:Fe-S cluster assembly protein SufD [Deltaproteobacteria bacterium]